MVSKEARIWGISCSTAVGCAAIVVLVILSPLIAWQIDYSIGENQAIAVVEKQVSKAHVHPGDDVSTVVDKLGAAGFS
jgi:hypothetical protein